MYNLQELNSELDHLRKGGVVHPDLDKSKVYNTLAYANKLLAAANTFADLTGCVSQTDPLQMAKDWILVYLHGYDYVRTTCPDYFAFLRHRNMDMHVEVFRDILRQAHRDLAKEGFIQRHRHWVVPTGGDRVYRGSMRWVSLAGVPDIPPEVALNGNQYWESPRYHEKIKKLAKEHLDARA